MLLVTCRAESEVLVGWGGEFADCFQASCCGVVSTDGIFSIRPASGCLCSRMHEAFFCDLEKTLPNDYIDEGNSTGMQSGGSVTMIAVFSC